MECIRKINDELYYVGGSDRRLALFENIFPVPKGVSYNSYLLLDEKTVLFDTADHSVSRIFLENVQAVLAGRKLDYLVVNHMEPDHAATLEDILLRYPEVTLVGNAKTWTILDQFLPNCQENYKQSQRLTVTETDTLETGRHSFQFVMAPMVHWPEVMMTYDATDHILFSADAFGTFGALDGILFNDEVNFERDWLEEARRYYTNIVGKYGIQVQNVLKKAATLDIQTICPLHGPVWRSNLSWFIEKYQCWSSYTSEEKGVVIVYASMYGDTENAANVLAARLADAKVGPIRMFDVSCTNVSYLISEVFHYTHLVLASVTYNGQVYPTMENFIQDMKALSVQGKKVAIMENGTWAAMSGKKIREQLEVMRNMTIIEEKVTIKSAVCQRADQEVTALAEIIARDF